jgi:predicted phosphodiesterase
MTTSLPEPPGRSCPLDYRYSARALCGPATLAADSLWIAGGLYGNPFALAELERMVAADVGPVLVFNGDFHWFDIDAGAFGQIEAGVARHIATQGNIEAELASPHAGAGCGCAYPGWVGDAIVEYSNRIMNRLQATAARVPGAAARLAALPMHRVAEVGGLRVGIVHGDAESLAGWGFSQEALGTAEGRRAALEAFAAADVSVFASSHTCLPVLQAFEGGRIVVNNGSAGMANFAGTGYGLATRVALAPHPGSVYGARIGPVHVEAIPIRFDGKAWREAFLGQWPEGSAAHASYYSRIVEGPAYSMSQGVRAA